MDWTIELICHQSSIKSSHTTLRVFEKHQNICLFIYFEKCTVKTTHVLLLCTQISLFLIASSFHTHQHWLSRKGWDLSKMCDFVKFLILAKLLLVLKHPKLGIQLPNAGSFRSNWSGRSFFVYVRFCAVLRKFLFQWGKGPKLIISISDLNDALWPNCLN